MESLGITILPEPNRGYWWLWPMPDGQVAGWKPVKTPIQNGFGGSEVYLDCRVKGGMGMTVLGYLMELEWGLRVDGLEVVE